MSSLNAVKVILWMTPFFMVGLGFLTSMISRFRFPRYAIALVILFIAFLLDLQSKSFVNDKLDLLLTQVMVLVFADITWRLVRKKNKVLRIIGLIFGIALFIGNYHEWIMVGPASINRLWNARILTEKKMKKAVYFVKKRCFAGFQKQSKCNLVLLKRVVPPFIEQRIDLFEIPQGYDNAEISLIWQQVEELVTVQVIGDKDTLWTLTEKFPQVP